MTGAESAGWSRLRSTLQAGRCFGEAIGSAFVQSDGTWSARVTPPAGTRFVCAGHMDGSVAIHLVSGL